MPALNLAALQAAANKKHTDFEFDAGGDQPLRFHPILRRDRETRQAYADAMDIELQVKTRVAAALEEEGASAKDDFDLVSVMIDCIREGFRIVAHSPEDFEQLDAALKVPGPDGVLVDDLGIWEELAYQYREATESGKA